MTEATSDQNSLIVGKHSGRDEHEYEQNNEGAREERPIRVVRGTRFGVFWRV
jgi:hypothetical protein